MKMAVTGRMGTSSLLLALLLTYGCASPPIKIKMEKGELARIRTEGEIQAVHYSRATPTVDFSDPEPQSAAVILILPFYLWDSHQKSKQVEELSLEDPALRVKERFVLAMDTALDLKSVRLVQEPLVGDDLDELKAALGKGLVIDFRTILWFIGNWRRSYNNIGYYDKIMYSVRSRIVRLADSKILWQGVCDLDHKFPSWDELMAANGTLLKVKGNELAESCAQELLAQLLEKDYFEYLSAQAVSGGVRLPRGRAILSPELVKRAPSVTTAWTFYAASRIQYRNDHHLEISEAKGGVKATFEEEVYAREAMVKFWQKVGEDADRDDYLEKLAAVVFAGFLREYVHVFISAASDETTISKLRLKDFELWKKEYLPGHSAKILATIRPK